MSSPQTLLDPVAAYDRIASTFARLSAERRAYLDGIDKLVLAGIPTTAHTWLDVGAGPGGRAIQLVEMAGIKDLTLLEPSANMRSYWPVTVNGWAMRAEDLGEKHGSFDVITCLWNVLGHIFPAENRVNVFRHLARLLSPQGLIFVDVSYRYNARHYGWWPTALRMAYDCVRPRWSNGDVVACWKIGNTSCTTSGHVFTDREIRQLAQKTGLMVRKRVAVDYATGALCRWPWQGHLLYVLQRDTH